MCATHMHCERSLCGRTRVKLKLAPPKGGYRGKHRTNIRPDPPEGVCLQKQCSAVHWQFGILIFPVLGRLSAKLGPKAPLERRGSSCSDGCTKNQPRGPILMKAMSWQFGILKSPPSNEPLRKLSSDPTTTSHGRWIRWKVVLHAASWPARC